MRIPPPLSVGARDVDILRGWLKSATVGEVAARRARIVLLSAQGLGSAAVAKELGCSKQTVATWRERYRSDGIAGLRDAPRSGRPTTVDAVAVVTRTLEPPVGGAARWSTRLLAAELGISNVAVANVWRSWGVTPLPGGRVRLGTEPALDGCVLAVVGGLIDPPSRLLAVLVGEPEADPDAAHSVPVRRRPGLGTRLSSIDPGTPACGGRGDLHTEFLHRLAGVDGQGARRLRLLAEVATDPVRHWAQARPEVILHLAPPTVGWERLARVACLLAGASADGAASVAAFREAVASHVAGGPFAWTRGGPRRACPPSATHTLACNVHKELCRTHDAWTSFT